MLCKEQGKKSMVVRGPGGTKTRKSLKAATNPKMSLNDGGESAAVENRGENVGRLGSTL